MPQASPTTQAATSSPASPLPEQRRRARCLVTAIGTRSAVAEHGRVRSHGRGRGPCLIRRHGRSRDAERRPAARMGRLGPATAHPRRPFPADSCCHSAPGRDWAAMRGWATASRARRRPSLGTPARSVRHRCAVTSVIKSSWVLASPRSSWAKRGLSAGQQGARKASDGRRRDCQKTRNPC
jgi:hypothetical protein